MNKLIPYSLIVILLCCVVGLFRRISVLDDRLKNSKADTLVVTDTLVVHDTIRTRMPKPQSEIIIDTLYVYLNDTVFMPLPKTSKTFSDGKTYKAWISGVYPQLDSIDVYRKVEYVTKRIYKDVIRDEWNSYVFMGANQFYDGFSPSVGIAVKSPKRWLFGIETGYYNDNMWGGLKIGYKIR